jgi:hypothetical protein
MNAGVIFQDPDTLWHIRAGDLIRSQGITTEEPWSWTAGSYPWINIAWLPDIAMSWLYEKAGLSAIQSTALLVFSLTLATLAATAHKLNAHPVASVIVLFYSAGILAEGLPARPQMITLLLAVLAYQLLRFANNNQLWLLIPLQWLWANSHGGYIVMFVLIGLFAIEAATRHNQSRTARLCIIAAACMVVPFLNPYGIHIVHAIMAVLGTQANVSLHEWQPTAPAQYIYLLGWLLLMVIAGGMQNKQIPLADKLLAIFWLVMAMMSLRMTYLAAIFSFPYLVQSLSVWSRTLSPDANASFADSPKLRLTGLGCALVISIALISPLNKYLLSSPALPASIAPSQELEFIAEHYPALRFFTHYNFGGYLIYRRDLAVKPFVDGRAETAYPKEVIADYFTLHNMQPGWHDIASRRGIQGLMIPLKDINHPDQAALQPLLLDKNNGWKRVFTGSVAAVYVRTELAK